MRSLTNARITGLAGLLGAGHSSEMQVLITFKDGRSCVISGPAKGVSLLLQVGRSGLWCSD